MKKSHLVILLLSLSFFVSGYFEGTAQVSNVQAIGFMHIIFISIMAFIWCKSHAAEKGITAPLHSALLCGLLVVIGVPIYIYRGFGFKSSIEYSLALIVLIIFWITLYGVSFDL